MVETEKKKAWTGQSSTHSGQPWQMLQGSILSALLPESCQRRYEIKVTVTATARRDRDRRTHTNESA
jgi:hypothetical protein